MVVSFFRTVVLALIEFIVAILRLGFLLTSGLSGLYLRLREWLRELFGRENLFPEETRDPCGNLPEALVRRPDPCLYSQQLLMSKGLPVTWDNPDVWIAPADHPTNVLPDSYHLEEDTDYVVSVRISNASATDPAIGARVRLRYRPWSFNSPDRTPVETDATGAEVVKFVHVPPMSSAIAQFDWHTPTVEPDRPSQHFCLQATVDHPLDTNLGNNEGQENTNVYRTDNPGQPRPGDDVTVTVPLVNPDDDDRRFEFEIDTFGTDERDEIERHELRLETTRGYAPGHRSRGVRLANRQPTVRGAPAGALASAGSPTRRVEGSGVSSRVAPTFRSFGRLSLRAKEPIVATRSKYTGYDAIREEVRSEDHALPAGFELTVDDVDVARGVELEANEEQDLEVTISIPESAMPGTKLPVNITATDEDGVPVGGVTVVLDIEEA